MGGVNKTWMDKEIYVRQWSHFWLESRKSEGEGKILIKGSIEKIEVGKLLQFTSFEINKKYSDIPSNYVEAKYELTPKLGKTVLSITQGDYSRVQDGKERFANADGGLNQALNMLKTLIEKKQWELRLIWSGQLDKRTLLNHTEFFVFPRHLQEIS